MCKDDQKAIKTPVISPTASHMSLGDMWGDDALFTPIYSWSLGEFSSNCIFYSLLTIFSDFLISLTSSASALPTFAAVSVSEPKISSTNMMLCIVRISGNKGKNNNNNKVKRNLRRMRMHIWLRSINWMYYYF